MARRRTSFVLFCFTMSNMIPLDRKGVAVCLLGRKIKQLRNISPPWNCTFIFIILKYFTLSSIYKMTNAMWCFILHKIAGLCFLLSV